MTVNNFAVHFNSMPMGGGSDCRLYYSPNIKLNIWLELDTCLFLGPSGSTGGPLLLQCLSGVADAPRMSRCLNTQLLSPHPCFITVFSLILTVAHDHTLMS